METAALPVCDIRFEEEPHRYLLRGVAIPSVTQIMEPMSLMLYNGIPADVMYEAANRGTRVHEQVSNFVKYGIEEIDEDTKPYFQAFQKFQAEYEPHWAESEYRTYHKTLRYAGTLDLIGFVEPDDGRFEMHQRLSSGDAGDADCRLRRSPEKPRRSHSLPVWAAASARWKLPL